MTRKRWSLVGCCALAMLVSHSAPSQSAAPCGSSHASHGARWTQALPLGDHYLHCHPQPACPSYGNGYGYRGPRFGYPNRPAPSIYYYPYKSNTGNARPRTPLEQTAAGLVSSNDKVSRAARRKLSASPPGAEQLAQWLESPDAALRASAAEMIGWQDETAAALIPQLAQALKDDEYMVRLRAAWSLGRIGPQAQSAVNALSDALRDSNTDVRVYVQDALDRMQVDVAAPTRRTLVSK